MFQQHFTAPTDRPLEVGDVFPDRRRTLVLTRRAGELDGVVAHIIEHGERQLIIVESYDGSFHLLERC